MAQQVDDIPQRCPYLGIPSDPESYFAFPTEDNACHKVSRVATIAADYQSQYCLGDYRACPIYQQKEAWTAPLPPEAKAKTSRRSTRAALRPADPIKRKRVRRNIIIVTVVTLAVGLGLLLVAINVVVPALLDVAGGGATPTLAAMAPTATVTLEPVAVVTEESPAPTATFTTAAPTEAAPPTTEPTPEPAATETPTVTPTPNNVVSIEVLEFESNIRIGPDTSYEAIRLVPAGTEVGVIARDLNGFWLLVQLPDGTEGWVALTQIAGNPDIVAIPVATNLPPTLTPATTDEPPEPTTEG